MRVYARFVGQERALPGAELVALPPGPSGFPRFAVRRGEAGALEFELDRGTLRELRFAGGFDEEALAFALAQLGCEGGSSTLRVIFDFPPPSAARLKLHLLRRPPSSPAEPLVNALRCALPWAAEAAYRLRESVFPRTYLAQGRCGGAPLRALLKVPAPKAALLAETMFDVPVKAEPSADAPDVDLEIESVPERMAARCDFATPSSVRAVLDIPRSVEDYERALPHSARSDIKKMAKAGFSPRISCGREDFILFYRSMYLPTLEAAHECNAVRPSFAELESLFKRGFILFACAGASTLGGVLAYDCGGGRLALKAMGFLEGDAGIMRTGAGAALYYYSIRHAAERGFSILDFGLGGPFRTIGLTAYKNKWNARFVTDSGESALSFRFRSARARELVQSRLRPFRMGELGKMSPPR